MTGDPPSITSNLLHGSRLALSRRKPGYSAEKVAEIFDISMEDLRYAEKHDMVFPARAPSVLSKIGIRISSVGASQLPDGNDLRRWREGEKLSCPQLSHHTGIPDHMLQFVERLMWPVPPLWILMLQTFGFDARAPLSLPKKQTYYKRSSKESSPTHKKPPAGLDTQKSVPAAPQNRRVLPQPGGIEDVDLPHGPKHLAEATRCLKSNDLRGFALALGFISSSTLVATQYDQVECPFCRHPFMSLRSGNPPLGICFALGEKKYKACPSQEPGKNFRTYPGWMVLKQVRTLPESRMPERAQVLRATMETETLRSRHLLSDPDSTVGLVIPVENLATQLALNLQPAEVSPAPRAVPAAGEVVHTVAPAAAVAEQMPSSRRGGWLLAMRQEYAMDQRSFAQVLQTPPEHLDVVEQHSLRVPQTWLARLASWTRITVILLPHEVGMLSSLKLPGDDLGQVVAGIVRSFLAAQHGQDPAPEIPAQTVDTKQSPQAGVARGYIHHRGRKEIMKEGELLGIPREVLVHPELLNGSGPRTKPKTRGYKAAEDLIARVRAATATGQQPSAHWAAWLTA